VEIAAKVIVVSVSVVCERVAWEAGVYPASLNPGLGDLITPLLLLPGILLLGQTAFVCAATGQVIHFLIHHSLWGNPEFWMVSVTVSRTSLLSSTDLGLIVYASWRCHHLRSRTVRTCYTCTDTDSLIQLNVYLLPLRRTRR
jgi:hypothetical protein